MTIPNVMNSVNTENNSNPGVNSGGPSSSEVVSVVVVVGGDIIVVIVVIGGDIAVVVVVIGGDIAVVIVVVGGVVVGVIKWRFSHVCQFSGLP